MLHYTHMTLDAVYGYLVLAIAAYGIALFLRKTYRWLRFHFTGVRTPGTSWGAATAKITEYVRDMRYGKRRLVDVRAEYQVDGVTYPIEAAIDVAVSHKGEFQIAYKKDRPKKWEHLEDQPLEEDFTAVRAAWFWFGVFLVCGAGIAGYLYATLR